MYGLSCTFPDETEIISINFFMVSVIANWGNVKDWLIERTFKSFAFVEIIGRTLQAETYEENSWFWFCAWQERVFTLK